MVLFLVPLRKGVHHGNYRFSSTSSIVSLDRAGQCGHEACCHNLKGRKRSFDFSQRVWINDWDGLPAIHARQSWVVAGVIGTSRSWRVAACGVSTYDGEWKKQGQEKEQVSSVVPKNKLDQVVATPRAIQDLDYWRTSGNQKKLDRINALIANCLETPFSGIGVPEQLRFQDQDTYSRRIDKTHRLVYRVEGKKLVIISARFHYQK